MSDVRRANARGLRTPPAFRHPSKPNDARTQVVGDLQGQAVMLDADATPQSTDSINTSTTMDFRTIRQQLISSDGGPPSEDRSAKQGASLSTVMFNLLATCLGAGILGLPYAYSGSGLIGGSILLVVCAGLSAFGAHLLVEAADRSGRPASFYSVAQAVGGPRAGVFMDFLIFVMSFGAAVSYLIVVGGVLPDVAMSFGATVEAKHV